MNKFFRNYIYNFLYQFFILITPIITTPYISRVIGAEGIGVYSYTLSLSTYFMYVASLGLPIYGQRQTSFYQDNKFERSKHFFEVLFTRLFSSMVIFFVYVGYIWFFEDRFFLIALLQGIGILSAVFDISWFFAGMEEFKSIVARNILIKLGTIFAIFLFVNDQSDLYIYVLCLTLTNLLGNISLFLLLPKYIHKVPIKDLCYLRNIKSALKLLLPSLMIQIYTVIDKTLLGKMGSSFSEVGFYEQSQKIISLCIALVSSLGTVLLPRISFLYSQNDNKSIERYINLSIRVTLFTTLPLVLGMVGVTDNFVPWFFGTGFEKVKLLLLIFSPLILIMGINSVIGMQYLIAINRELVLTKYLLYGTLINITLDVILIPHLDSIGTAIATLIAECSVMFFLLYNIKKEIHVSIKIKTCINYVVSSIIMFLTIVSIKVYYDLSPTILNTLLLIAIGGLAYISVLYFFKDEYVKLVTKIIKIKGK